MSHSIRHDFAVMGTVVSFRLVGDVESPEQDPWNLVRRAEDRFRQVEAVCSRFEPESELSRLCARPRRPVPVSELLYRAVEYALEVADASGGAFDPTAGSRLESLGFDRNWRTRERVRSVPESPEGVSFRDVLLDPLSRTIELARPLLLDLGAVAKGLAIDMAVRELTPLENFTVAAGGDVYLAGRNQDGGPWSVGVRHPREEDQLIETFTATDTAVCTSGDYERRAAGDEHHILDPRTGASAAGAASVTVVAPSAMAADALATAAFVLGPKEGLALLEREGVDGVIFTRGLERFETRLWRTKCGEARSALRA